MDCINLESRVGSRYRITFDEAYNAKGKHRDNLDPWYLQIRCRYGCIYPEGGDWLRLDLDHHNQIAGRVAELPGCELVQDGDFEKTIRFPVSQFPQVAAIVHPHRRRQYSEAERAAIKTRLARHHFKSRTNSGKIGARTRSEAVT
jgi:hypothetical protein